jgi:GDP-L-fucose synthase
VNWLQGKRVLVAGHRGLAGSAITRELGRTSLGALITHGRDEVDLEDPVRTREMLIADRPHAVFLAAGKVGGILANDRFPVDFLVRNLLIEAHVIQSAYAAGVERLLFLGSSCIYPRDAEVPIRETALLTGPLQPTNRPYALAKIAGIEMCWAYNRQYGTRYLSIMPTNLYGPGDNYDPETSHVLPALIRKVHEAKSAARDEVVLWGSGTPRREFLHSDDLARAAVFLANLEESRFSNLTEPSTCPLINIGTGLDLSVRDLALVIADVIGWHGRFAFDPTKPDGTMRKTLDISRIRQLGWQPRIPLADGIRAAYDDFLARGAGASVAGRR